MMDFSSLPSRPFARAALALLVGSITVGTSIGTQSMVLKGRADVVPAQATPDPAVPEAEVTEPTVVEEWPSLLNSSPSSAEESLEEAGAAEIDAGGGTIADEERMNRLPEELAMMVQRIDRAASNENINGVMRFYSDDLQHSDGITAKDLEAMLTEFWEIYDSLNYSTEVMNWQATDAGFITTTITTVTGQKAFGSQPLTFEATVESRQVIRDRQIIEQDILAESSQIQLGQTPPTVQVSLPATVAPGETFYFDAIVLEPIGNSLLMGTAFSDPVSLETYRTVPSLDVNVLGAGGLFKVSDASLEPSQEWVSGLLFREDGITGVTQRLRIVSDR